MQALASISIIANSTNSFFCWQKTLFYCWFIVRVKSDAQMEKKPHTKNPFKLRKERQKAICFRFVRNRVAHYIDFYVCFFLFLLVFFFYIIYLFLNAAHRRNMKRSVCLNVLHNNCCVWERSVRHLNNLNFLNYVILVSLTLKRGKNRISLYSCCFFVFWFSSIHKQCFCSKKKIVNKNIKKKYFHIFNSLNKWHSTWMSEPTEKHLIWIHEMRKSKFLFLLKNSSNDIHFGLNKSFLSLLKFIGSKWLWRAASLCQAGQRFRQRFGCRLTWTVRYITSALKKTF